MVVRFFSLLILAASLNAWAHSDHDVADADKLYGEIAKHQFFVDGGSLPDNSTSYVLLPDGTKYPLNSEFWSSAREFAHALELVDEGNDGEEAKASFWRRTQDKVNLLAQKHFWVRLSGTGVDYLYRYGPVTMLLFATAEFVEHTIFPFPTGFCFAIQTACVAGGKHLKRLWELLRYRYPLNEPLWRRFETSIKQLGYNYRFWRAMRLVRDKHRDGAVDSYFPKSSVQRHEFSEDNLAHALLWNTPFWSAPFVGGGNCNDGGCNHLHGNGLNKLFAEAIGGLPQADMRDPLQRFFRAQERAAIWELQLGLAKQMISSLAETEPRIYLSLRTHLARVGRAVDSYTTVVIGGALTDKANLELGLKVVDRKFLQFFTAVNGVLQDIKSGERSLETESGKALSMISQELVQEIRSLQKNGCKEMLTQPEVAVIRAPLF